MICCITWTAYYTASYSLFHCNAHFCKKLFSNTHLSKPWILHSSYYQVMHLSHSIIWSLSSDPSRELCLTSVRSYSSSVTVTERITTLKYKIYFWIMYSSIFWGCHVSERIGAEEAHWAHNPRVGGSKLPFARTRFAVCRTRHRSPLHPEVTPVRYGRHHCGAEEKMVGYLFVRLKSTSVCWNHPISVMSSKHLQHFCPLPLPPALDFILQ